MPDSKKTRTDILELLREAEAENNKAANIDKTSRDPEIEKTIIVDENEPKKKKTKVTKRINAETAELIDMYSTFDGEKPLSDTQKLREKLARQNDSEELLGYLGEEQKSGKSERVEKLYAMINDAKTRTLSDLEKKPPVSIDRSRFTDEADVEIAKPEDFKQEQMFNLGDTLRLDNTAPTATASYDSDYEKLAEKVVASNIPFEDEDEDQIKFITDDQPEIIGEPLDDTDKNLRLAFEMMEDEDGELEKLARQNEEKRKKDAAERKLGADEYTTRERNAEFARKFKKKMKSDLRKALLVFVLMLGILFLELATKDSAFHSDFIKQGKYGILYILIDLQLLFFIALLLLEKFRSGLKGLFTFKLNTDSLLAVTVLVSAAYSIVLLLCDPQSVDLKLYNLPAAFAALCSAVSSYLNSRKDYRCFRAVASKRSKYVACKVSGKGGEADEFYKYLFDDSEIYTVRKADFVDNFVERTERRSGFDDILNFVVPIIFGAGVILFGVMLWLKKDLVPAYAAFSVLIAASVPATAFFNSVLPIVSANRIGKKHSTAFVGSAVTEEYASASVLSFADTEVYPASLVKITNIRLYGENRIDTVITELASAFDYLGGPLKKVLASTVSDNVRKPNIIRIIENSGDGLCIAMDGKNYFLGKRSYIRRYRFECPVDEGDDAYENGVGSVMYVVIDEKIAAKLYIKYSVNPLFDGLLKDMYKAGLCLGIKTLDPNISSDLVDSGINFKKCPIAVLRGIGPADVAGEVERADSGIVCNSTLHNFLKMFALCDKARNITKSNVVISVLSVFLSFVAVAFLAVTGDLGAITSLHAVAFQLFWLLPVCITSILLK